MTRARISGHYTNDDPRHFAFVRDTRLPRGTFDHPLRMTADRWLWIACAALLVALMVASCS